MASGGIGRASMLLASGTMVSRVLGFVKAIVLAQTIGVVGSISADAFANANMLPSNIFSLISGGMLSAVLVPQVVYAARHPDGGQRYINRLVTLAIVLLFGLTVLATVAVPLISSLYGASLQPETLALVIAFGFWCMPQVFFYGLYAVLGEVLNARGVFGPFAWAPVLNNVVGIGFLGLFAVLYGADPTGDRSAGEWTPDMIALLGSTTTAGVALQAIILFFFWRRAGLTFRLDFQFRGTGLSKAGRLAGWTFGMLLIMQFAGLVETIVANIASGEAASLAAMQNAFLIFVLPHSIITVSIATAYFTRMSTAASEGRRDDLVRDFSGGARLIGMFIVFAALAIAVISPAFSRIFETRQEGVDALAIILCCFLVGLVTFCGLFLVQRAFYALEDTRTQFWVFLATMPLHVFGMAIVATLDVSVIVAGLALMQSFMSALRLGILMWLLRRRVGHLGTRRIVHSYTRFVIAAVIASIVGIGVMWLLGTYSHDGFSRSGIAPAFISCAVGGIVMVIVYVIALWFARSEELRETLAPILRRFGLGRLVGAGDADADADAPVSARADGADAGGAAASGAAASGGAAATIGEAGAQQSSERSWFDSESDADANRGSTSGDALVEAGAPASGGRAPVDNRGPSRDEDARARGGGLDNAWTNWLDDAGSLSGYGSADRGVDRREEEAYHGSFTSWGGTSDLTTAGILLPMHATPNSGPTSRRERRDMEQAAARALAERRTGPSGAAERRRAQRRDADQGATPPSANETGIIPRTTPERHRAADQQAHSLFDELFGDDRDA